MVIEPTIFPRKKLLSNDHTPKNWGLTFLQKISDSIDLSEIGFISVAYNATSHQEILPNLACQIAMDAGLELDKMPNEIAYYGCASGIFSISEAIDYCRTHQRAAFVYVFDQCNWITNPIYDMDNPNFKASLRAHSLFSDGGVGILLIPETMRYQFPGPLMKIIDINKKFQLGDVIKMEESFFLVRKGVSETMPALTAKCSIKPLLEKHSLTPEQITQWSIHQGGLPVLSAFKEDSILGLSDEQIQRSKDLFQKYGNFSSPSCLYVLNSFFQDKQTHKNSYGIVTSFGAGYYFGSFLYQWE
ncbi:MAG: 3-oxoacyl-[acyl-carrier-protein] synthase III C-terminal domain-containing protein [Calothrix sp. MO_167.B12]|nr:3-oxoacyl-[acyl-carrier-protein] synthase III C-terminal domain-containing protein [Calothrix sp. MO_167.B12]